MSLSLSLLRIRKGVGVERGTSGLRRSALLRREALARGGIRALIARGEGTGIWGHDDRRAVVYGGRVGQMRLAQARRGGEMDAGTDDRGGQGKGEGVVVRRRRRRRWWVRVCAVFEAWAQGSPRHSRLGVGRRGDKTKTRSLDPTGVFSRGLYERGG